MTLSSHRLDIRATSDGAGRRVLVLDGDIDLTTCGALRDEITAAAEEAPTVVLDLRDVTFMDSPGLGTLIYCHHLLADDRTTLIVRAPRGHVQELFDLVQLETMIPVEPDT
jgi:anti-anti-sigma factor